MYQGEAAQRSASAAPHRYVGITVGLNLTSKKRDDLGPQSGVGWMRLLGGGFALAAITAPYGASASKSWSRRTSHADTGYKRARCPSIDPS